MLGISLYSYPYLKRAKKSYVFLIIAYVFYSTKLEKGENRFCLEAKGVRGRDGPNYVCTYE
jgi:hypothetical protein